MRSILVLRGGALGDFIVTLPALAALRARWPAARIELAGNATATALAVARGLVDNAHSQHEARWGALFGAAPLPAEFGAWLAQFDLVVSWWPDPDGALRRHFPRHATQTFLAGDAHPRIAPAAAHYCATLRPLGLEPREFFHRLAPEPAARAGITVHPGSGSPRKNWPRERWLALIANLPAPVTLVLGEAEVDGWSALTRRRRASPRAPCGASTRLARGWSEQRVGVNALHLAVDLPLEELAAHLATCRLFLGHDSGVSHLAAACGAPCLILFGPTDPAVWAPPAPHVRTIKRGETMEAIAVEDVRALL